MAAETQLWESTTWGKGTAHTFGQEALSNLASALGMPGIQLTGLSLSHVNLGDIGIQLLCQGIGRFFKAHSSALFALLHAQLQQVLLNESSEFADPPPPASLGVVGAQPLASCAPSPVNPPLHPMSSAPTHPALPFPPVNFHNCICKVLSSHGAPFHAFVPLTPPYPQQLRDPSLCSVPNIFSLPCPTFPKEKFTKLIQHVGTHLPLITPHYFSTLVQPPSALHLASLTPLLPPLLPRPHPLLRYYCVLSNSRMRPLPLGGGAGAAPCRSWHCHSVA